MSKKDKNAVKMRERLLLKNHRNCLPSELRDKSKNGGYSICLCWGKKIVKWCQIRRKWKVINQFKATVMHSSHCNHWLVCRSSVLAKQDSLRQFSRSFWRNVSSNTFRKLPEYMAFIQCEFIWKETMQLVSGKVEFNAYQVLLLRHNSLAKIIFQPSTSTCYLTEILRDSSVVEENLRSSLNLWVTVYIRNKTQIREFRMYLMTRIGLIRKTIVKKWWHKCLIDHLLINSLSSKFKKHLHICQCKVTFMWRLT